MSRDKPILRKEFSAVYDSCAGVRAFTHSYLGGRRDFLGAHYVAMPGVYFVVLVHMAWTIVPTGVVVGIGGKAASWRLVGGTPVCALAETGALWSLRLRSPGVAATMSRMRRPAAAWLNKLGAECASGVMWWMSFCRIQFSKVVQAQIEPGRRAYLTTTRPCRRNTSGIRCRLPPRSTLAIRCLR